MMIKNKDVIQVLLSTTTLTPNELVKYLGIVVKLKQRYGGVLEQKAFYSVLGKTDKHLAEIIMILDKTKINSIKKIKDIIFQTKKLPKYQTQLEVAIKDENFDELSEYLKKTLPKSKITKKEGEDAEVSVSGNGWYYKKSFDKDVEKLLS